MLRRSSAGRCGAWPSEFCRLRSAGADPPPARAPGTGVSGTTGTSGAVGVTPISPPGAEAGAGSPLAALFSPRLETPAPAPGAYSSKYHSPPTFTTPAGAVGDTSGTP